MNWSDLLKNPEVVGPLAATLAGAVALVSWIVKHHIRHLNESITGLRRGLDKSKLEVLQAEAARDAAVVAKDRAEHEAGVAKIEAAGQTAANAGLKKARDHWEGEAKKVRDAGQQEYVRRKAAEQHVATLKTQLDHAQASLTAAVTLGAERAAELIQTKQTLAVAETSLARVRKRAAAVRKRLRQSQGQLAAVVKHGGKVWLSPVPPTAPPFVPLATRKTAVVAVLNLKGGVGKTTLTANLAGLLGADKKRVLLIDLDHQRSLSFMLLSEADRVKADDTGRTVQHVLTADPPTGAVLVGAAEKVAGAPDVALVSCVDAHERQTATPALDDLESRLMASWLINRPDGADARFILRAAAHGDTVRDNYDYILIDCPPRLTTGCVNAIAAADVVLIPVQPEAVAARSVQHLLFRLRDLRKAGVVPPSLTIALLANMVPERGMRDDSPETALMTRVGKAADLAWGSSVRRIETMIPRAYQFAEATARLDAGSTLRLAIEFPAVRKAVGAVARELMGVIDACRGPGGVSS